MENRPSYTDFLVWTPFERRMSRVQKCRVYTRHLPSARPTSSKQLHSAWKASWNVFKAACLMLNICSIASLEAYAKQVEKLTTQWPRCWGLIYLAHDSGRAERLEKIRRKFTIWSQLRIDRCRGLMGPRPWSCVFVQLAMDSEFWAERVHYLAAAWTASGGKGAPCITTAAADAIQGGQGALGHEQELGQGTSDSRRIQANRDGRQAKKRQTLGVRTRKASSSQSFSPFLFRQRSWRWKREGQRKIQRPIRSGALLQLGVRERTLCRCSPGGECKGPVKRIHKCRICLPPSQKDAGCRSG